MLKEIEVTEPVQKITWQDENDLVDDVLIIADLKGTNNAPIQIAIRNINNKQAASNMNYSIGNYFRESEIRYFNSYIERVHTSLWNIRVGGTLQYNNIIRAPSNPQIYEHKIYRVQVYTNGENMINEGNVKIYGRNRYESIR